MKLSPHDQFVRIIQEAKTRQEIKQKVIDSMVDLVNTFDDYCYFLYFFLLSAKDRTIKKEAFDNYLIDEFKESENIELLLSLAFNFEEADDVVWINERMKAFGMTDVLKRIYLKAQYDIPLLILGESGTGKESMARIIHKLGNRRGEPFVPINCAAIPENLIESELFGHKKGAFTGADQDMTGLIAAANGGTLFLDELGRASKPLQHKLLRYLQDGTFYRIGDRKESHSDVRIIAASQREKLSDVEPDLLFRLNSPAPISLSPLRDKLYYIEPHMIVENLLERVTKRLKIGKKVYHSDSTLVNIFSGGGLSKSKEGKISLNQKCYELIMSYNWPGNYRELESVLCAALINAQSENRDELKPSDFPILKFDIDEMLKHFQSPERMIRKNFTYEDIALKDIISHAEKISEKVKAEIVEQKMTEIVNSGKKVKAVLLDQGLPETQYSSFTTQIKKLTGKSIRQFYKGKSVL